MRTYVRTVKCDGCGGRDKAYCMCCMYIRPHDLMLLDSDGSMTGNPVTD